jgi:hypothetical protein
MSHEQCMLRIYVPFQSINPPSIPAKSHYAAASRVPLIQSPSLRVPRPVELPPDIHPLPESLNPYVSQIDFSHHDPISLLRKLSLPLTYCSPICYPVRLPFHCRVTRPHGRVRAANCGRSSHGALRSVPPCARGCEGAPETRGASQNRAWIRTVRCPARTREDGAGSAVAGMGETAGWWTGSSSPKTLWMILWTDSPRSDP